MSPQVSMILGIAGWVWCLFWGGVWFGWVGRRRAMEKKNAAAIKGPLGFEVVQKQ